MIKIDSKFLQRVEVRAIRAEFGATGVMALIEIMCKMFESPQGYWLPWDRKHRTVFAAEQGMTLDELDRLIRRMGEYDMVYMDRLKSDDVLTSAYFQREFIRQCGAARASRLAWKPFAVLTADELLELGVIAAVVDPDDAEPENEPVGVPLPIAGRKDYMKVRVRTTDRRLHVYRRIRAGNRPRG